jgi:hypothetical protein
LSRVCSACFVLLRRVVGGAEMRRRGQGSGGARPPAGGPVTLAPVGARRGRRGEEGGSGAVQGAGRSSGNGVTAGGQAVAAAGHPFATGMGGMMGALRTEGRRRQSSDSTAPGGGHASTIAARYRCGSRRTRLGMWVVVQCPQVMIAHGSRRGRVACGGGGNYPDVAASIRSRNTPTGL